MRYAPWLLAAAILGTPAAFSQALKLDSLDKLAAQATNTVRVNLEGSMLRLATQFLSNDDPDQAHVKDMVKGLKGIYVRSYEFSKAAQYSASDVEAIRSQLRGSNWKSIVEVRSKDNNDNADVYVKEQGDQFAGIAIIAAEPLELTVVNIDGIISLEGLAKLSGNFGIPSDIRNKVEKKGK